METKSKKVPDGGYGWFIVLGCFMAHVLIGGFDRSEGIYFLQFTERFEKNAQLTSWPGALVSTIRHFLGPLAGILSSHYSARTTVMIGTLFMTVGTLLNAFCPDFFFLFVSHAALQGFGRGLMYAPSLIIVGTYFDKHRGLAAGLGCSGVGVGTFCIVPFTQWLFDTYLFQGAFTIQSAVALNGLVVAMLFRPLSLHFKFTGQQRNRGVDIQLKTTLLPKHQELGEKSDVKGLEIGEKNHLQIQPSPEPKIHKDGWFKSSLNICFPKENNKQQREKMSHSLHLSLLKDASFCIFCVSIMLFTSAFKAAFTFIPALVKTKGLSDSEAALVLSLSGVFDTIGRIVAGIILDIPSLRPLRPVVYNFFIFSIAAVSFTMPFFTSFLWLCVLCCVYGTLSGAYISQKSVLVVDILGVEHLASSFGLLICFQAVGTCVGPPLSGAFRDAFGSYDEAFYLGGSFMIVAGVLMVLCNICLRKKQHKKNNNEINIEIKL
ncbi:monocarboxylate transporter 12-like [Physella acuta]|uniref:monocarboxylate transporter 12-like n=1 Tax=Physella acuta TaxID=109671 RepID=UPI0027DB3638|nr:monocarboxylate transporter 12-like [Physella acuta]